MKGEEKAAMEKRQVLVFGSGYMAGEYLKVLHHLGCKAIVIGRDRQKAEKLAQQYGYAGMGEGKAALDTLDTKTISLAILACAVDALPEIAMACLKKGIKNILIEKPGSLRREGLEEIQKLQGDAKIRIAYNRRYYASVRKLKEMLKTEAIQGCFFEFTERTKDIVNSGKSKSVIERWGLANSTHVIDTAFFLMGIPKEMQSRISGSLPFHKAGATFTGMGKTATADFSYFSTWGGGGRWNVEISTDKGRYKLCPLESLSFCKKEQFGWEEIPLEDEDDIRFKPGLLKMVSAMLEGRAHDLPTVEEQIKAFDFYTRIFGYTQ